MQQVSQQQPVSHTLSLKPKHCHTKLYPKKNSAITFLNLEVLQQKLDELFNLKNSHFSHEATGYTEPKPIKHEPKPFRLLELLTEKKQENQGKTTSCLLVLQQNHQYYLHLCWK